MKVSINRDKCIGCGVCESTCPDVFKLAEDGKSSVVEKHRKGSLGEGKVDKDLTQCVEEAETSCSVEAISTE